MVGTSGYDRERLQRRLSEIAREWHPKKVEMASRALRREATGNPSESLDVIAADLGVSRETVRRARNEVLRDLKWDDVRNLDDRIQRSVSSAEGRDRVVASRALRRVLTMTGPLPLDELLAAWARAGGKSPYFPLPAESESMAHWADRAGGIFLRIGSNTLGSVAVVHVETPEPLDQVGQFLFDTLSERPNGVDRAELLEAAAAAGLRATTIATTLSSHPAVLRVGRGIWTLRGLTPDSPTSSLPTRGLEAKRRNRPTSFTWGKDGSLKIEFSMPAGPSPLVAVPKAVADFVEGRDFVIVTDDERRNQITIRNGRLWGFGPLVSNRSIAAGDRAIVALDLVGDRATFEAVSQRGPST